MQLSDVLHILFSFAITFSPLVIGVMNATKTAMAVSFGAVFTFSPLVIGVMNATVSKT